MTVIVGLVDQGNVYIGGDSAGIAGLSLSIRDDEKIFKNGCFIMGFTSSFRMGQLLRYKFSPPAQTIHQDDMQYMVTDFIDAARKCFAMNGFGDKDATEGGTFIVGYKGKLYTIQTDYQVACHSDNYDAVGCGADIALGSLYSTKHMKNMSPEDRITLALQAAATYSAGVSAPFKIVKQEQEVPIKPAKTVKPKKR